VLTAYEKARKWAIANPSELKQVVIKASKLTEAVATKQLEERTDISNSSIGDEQKAVISAAGDVLKKSGVIDDAVDVITVVNNLIDPQYVAKVAKS
jgi:sulfonate transport system substrate-binding protein